MKPRVGRHGETGFSLMELLVAMLVTLIVTGAIYGLIQSGQTAFRREPELADRQQNIRIAMDMIQRDVLIAGQGVPWLAQVFTINDPGGTNGACPAGLNGCGVGNNPPEAPGQGTLGAAAAAARGGGDPSENTDVLELITAEEQCPYYQVCSAGDIKTSNPVIVREPLDGSPLACMQQGGPTLLLATTNYNFAILPTVASTVGACPDPTGGGNRSFTTTGSAVGNWVPFAPCPPVGVIGCLDNSAGAWVTQARIARYEIAPDPVDNAPSLWRSTTGLFNPDGTAADRAGPGVGTWQLVARGIEDLQVEYLDGTGNWSNVPSAVNPVACAQLSPTPASCAAQAINVTRQVRVTLSSRSMAPVMLGAIRDGNGKPGSEALRGQLQAVITPRTAKVSLAIP